MTQMLTDAEVAALAGNQTSNDILTDADVAAMSAKAQGQSYTAGLARALFGQGALLGWGDEIMGRLRQAFAGEDYEKARDDERAKVAAFRKENPKTAFAAEIGGGFLTPGVGLVAGAMRPAATIGGRIWQGTKIGAGVGAIAGAGADENSVLEGAKHGALIGAPFGAAASTVGSLISGATHKTLQNSAPAFARLNAKVTGGDPVEAAADAVMKQWMRSGSDPAALRARLTEADRVRTFHGGIGAQNASEAQTPLALADLSPEMQKLAGSVVRANPKAQAQAEAFIAARQTGVRPTSATAERMATEAGIDVRNPYAPRDAGQAPAGQFERIGDALKRAFTIQDADFHKFGPTAYRTEQAMIQRLKVESEKLYGEARRAGSETNIAAVIEPLMKSMETAARALPVGEAGLVRSALRQFTTGGGAVVSDLNGFDKAKRAVDGLIGRFKTKGDNNAVRVLTDMKNNLLDAVDKIPDVGPKYKAARNYYSSEMELRDALNLGRKALSENSEVVADQIAQMSEGQRKLFRLGMHEAYLKSKGGVSRSNDVTRMFETPRVQEILEAAIPRSKGSGAAYVDRPERFGDLIVNEKAMIGTRDKVLGNSATAGRLADDARLTRQTVGEMFDRYRSSPSLFAIGMELASTGLNKVFGFRDDVAQELARRLFTAKPAERDAVLRRLEQNWGRNRVDAFVSMLNGGFEATAAVLANTGARAARESPSRQ